MNLARPSPDEVFRRIVTSMRNGVIAVDAAGRVSVLNGVAERVLRLAPDESRLGQPYVWSLGGCPDVARLFERALSHQVTADRAELRLAASGTVIGYTLTLMRDEAGAPAGAVLLFKDLTRVEQLEERERLKDRLAAIGEMAAAIAHEVKNPLASIEVLAGLLKRRLKEAPEAVAVLNEIIHEAKMANAIVVDVLDFARPLRLQVEEVDLARVIGDAVHLAERTAEPGQVEVRLDLAPALPAIKGDASQIRQLVANLVTNAYEALAAAPASASDTPAIVVSAWAVDRSDLPDGRGVAIEVADSGPGVPAELGERVFGPFVSTKPKGSGLGLANVRKVVDAHGGRVSLGAGRDGGAVFTVLLPHAPPHDSRLPDADIRPSPPAVRTAAGF